MKLHFGIALWEFVPKNKGMVKDIQRYSIETGMGLQKVDGLENSSYFKEVSSKYISNEINIDDLYELVGSYYESKENKANTRVEEADKVSLRIADILLNDGFVLSSGQFLAIHKRLFEGIYEKAGEFRTYNISKKEWVLDGNSITYGDYHDLEVTLEYDLEVERRYDYKGKSMDEIILHLASFVANLWQIHPFEEGNTRTTAVFFIKYLRSLGFDVTNNTFKDNAWYFRNALCRANYSNLIMGTTSDKSFLIKFLRNLLLEEDNVLENKAMQISLEMKNVNQNLNDLEYAVLRLIKENNKISSEELSNATGKSVRTIKTSLLSLQVKNKITRKNGKRYGYWLVL